MTLHLAFAHDFYGTSGYLVNDSCINSTVAREGDSSLIQLRGMTSNFCYSEMKAFS